MSEALRVRESCPAEESEYKRERFQRHRLYRYPCLMTVSKSKIYKIKMCQHS